MGMLHVATVSVSALVLSLTSGLPSADATEQAQPATMQAAASIEQVQLLRVQTSLSARLAQLAPTLHSASAEPQTARAASGPIKSGLTKGDNCSVLRHKYIDYMTYNGSFDGIAYIGKYHKKTVACIRLSRTKGRRFNASVTRTSWYHQNFKSVTKDFKGVKYVSQRFPMQPYKELTWDFWANKPKKPVTTDRFTIYQPR